MKKIFFTVITWLIIITGFNYLCGFIVKNRYIAVDAISKKTAANSMGYFEPNQDKIILFPGIDAYHVKINKLGLRSVGEYDDWELERFDDSYYRILTLGDSTTFGLFVNDEDAYPYRLQKKLTANGKKAVVFNAGVGGGTIADYLYYLQVKGLALKPDLVAINFCDNDLAELKGWKNPMYQKIMDENIFSLADTIKRAKFMRVFRKGELAYRYRRSTNKIKDPKVRSILFNESKNLDDIFYLVESGDNLTLKDPLAPELSASWNAYFDVLKQTIDLLKMNKIDYVFIIYPHIHTVFDKGKANYQDVIRPFLEANEIPYIDLRPKFKENNSRIMDLYNDLPRDFHLSGEGNQIVADEFYQLLISRSLGK